MAARSASQQPHQQHCAQCGELLRHLHQKNIELAVLKDQLAELAAYRDKKAREVHERLTFASISASIVADAAAPRAKSPSPTSKQRRESLLAPGMTRRESVELAVNGGDAAGEDDVTRRRFAALLQRNAELAGERDHAKGEAIALRNMLEDARRTIETLEDERREREAASYADDGGAHASSAPLVLQRSVSRLRRVASAANVSSAAPSQPGSPGPAVGNGTRSRTPDTSSLRRVRSAVQSPYIAESNGESQLPSHQHTPRQSVAPPSVVPPLLLQHDGTPLQQEDGHQQEHHSGPSSRLTSTPLLGSCLHRDERGPATTTARTPRSVGSVSSKSPRRQPPLPPPASAGPPRCRSPQPSTPESSLAGRDRRRAAIAAVASEHAANAAGDDGGWMSPNLALLSQEPELPQAKRSGLFSKRAAANIPRVASLSPDLRQAPRQVAAALGWQGARITNGRVSTTFGPAALAPAAPPDATLGSPRSLSPSTAQLVAGKGPRHRDDGTLNALAMLRGLATRANHAQFMAMLEVECRHDPFAPFKTAFEELKQIVAGMSEGCSRSGSTVADGAAPWPVSEAVLASIPQCFAARIARLLGRLVTVYDYVNGSEHFRTKADLSLSVHEFETNLPVLLALAHAEPVRELLMRH